MCSNSMASAHVIEVNQTNIKGGCQLGRKVVPHDSKSDLPLTKTIQNEYAFILSKNLNVVYGKPLATTTCLMSF